MFPGIPTSRHALHRRKQLSTSLLLSIYTEENKKCLSDSIDFSVVVHTPRVFFRSVVVNNSLPVDNFSVYLKAGNIRPYFLHTNLRISHAQANELLCNSPKQTTRSVNNIQSASNIIIN